MKKTQLIFKLCSQRRENHFLPFQICRNCFWHARWLIAWLVGWRVVQRWKKMTQRFVKYLLAAFFLPEQKLWGPPKKNFLWKNCVKKRIFLSFRADESSFSVVALHCQRGGGWVGRSSFRASVEFPAENPTSDSWWDGPKYMHDMFLKKFKPLWKLRNESLS